MKKIFIIITIILFTNSVYANSKGPFLLNKLTPPEKNHIQTLQKRSLIWIEGQWETINNKYQWKSGHWTNKKSGHVYVNGRWNKSNKGWQWEDGYWKKIDINKWINLYS